MIDISIQTNRYSAQLPQAVNNLEDVSCAMEVLSKLRDAEIQIDMTLMSIQV